MLGANGETGPEVGNLAAWGGESGWGPAPGERPGHAGAKIAPEVDDLGVWGVDGTRPRGSAVINHL